MAAAAVAVRHRCRGSSVSFRVSRFYLTRFHDVHSHSRTTKQFTRSKRKKIYKNERREEKSCACMNDIYISTLKYVNIINISVLINIRFGCNNKIKRSRALCLTHVRTLSASPLTVDANPCRRPTPLLFFFSVVFFFYKNICELTSPETW